MNDSLKELQRLSLLKKQQRYPNTPYVSATKYSDKTANGLTNCIVDYIDLMGGWATRVNSMGVYDAKEGKYRTSNTKIGTADVHGCLKGLHFSIEVKIDKDKLSEAQIRVQKRITDAGGFYFVATSFDEFYKWFNQITWR